MVGTHKSHQHEYTGDGGQCKTRYYGRSCRSVELAENNQFRYVLTSMCCLSLMGTYLDDEGRSLSSQLKEAHKMKTRHEDLFEEFTADFPPDVIEHWVGIIEAWNMDPSKPNPYEEVETGQIESAVYCSTLIGIPVTTMAKIRLELSEEELGRVMSGSVPPHQMSPHSFLHLGLDLEEQQ